MSINFSFNAHVVAPNAAPEPLPTGIYDVVLIDSKEVMVKDGNGASFFEMTMQVFDGEFKGRKVIERLNMKNANSTAVEIAMAKLSSMCHVTGVMVIQQSTAELYNKPFRIAVTKQARNDDPTKSNNEIREYYDMNGNPPGKQGQQNQAPQGFGQQPQGFGQQQQPVQNQAPAFAQTQQVQQEQPQQFQPPQTQQQAPAFAQTQQPAPVQQQPVQQAPVQQAPTFVAPSAAQIAAQVAAQLGGGQPQQQPVQQQPVQQQPVQQQPVQQAPQFVQQEQQPQAPNAGGMPDWAQ